MSKSFKVGDVCVVIYSYHWPELIGTELTITGPLREAGNTKRGETWFGYETNIITPNGNLFMPSPHQLRRRPPKSSDTEWANAKVKHLLKVKPEVLPC